MKKKIICAGILDTKGEEIKYIAKQIEAAGGEPVIMELSVGKETGWADIGLSQILAITGRTPEDLFKEDRHQAAAWVTEAAIKYVAKLYADGGIDGIISYGGSMGAAISSAVMQSLPLGVPKLLLTTMASGDVRPYVGTKDMCLMYPIAEAGLNSLTKQILTNAAYCITGMANAPKVSAKDDKPLIGCMMFGVTTPCVLRGSAFLEDKGYDVIINHAIGTGGISMEEMIEDGYVKGILDITTHEIADELYGGVLSAGPNRLTAASKKGIPQVVAPGGLDLLNFGTLESVPEHYIEDVRNNVRNLYKHNTSVTCVSVTPEEAYEIAKDMAGKLNGAKGPSVLCIPMKGWGACDIRTPDKALGWAGPAEGPSWISDPEKPEWSLRSRRYVQGIKENIDLNKDNLEVLIADYHMNEPEFSDLMSGILYDMLQGTWKKGKKYGTKVYSL